MAKSNAKTKAVAKKIGRPTKFNDEIQNEIERLALMGLTEIEIGERVGVTDRTFQYWKKRYPTFFRTIKNAKRQADEEVVLSLRDRARGTTLPETKAQWVNDDNGGHWEYAEMEKHYPPDPTSMIFWLKNRDPERWRDKQDIEHSGNVTVKVVKYSEEED